MKFAADKRRDLLFVAKSNNRIRIVPVVPDFPTIEAPQTGCNYFLFLLSIFSLRCLAQASAVLFFPCAELSCWPSTQKQFHRSWDSRPGQTGRSPIFDEWRFGGRPTLRACRRVGFQKLHPVRTCLTTYAPACKRRELWNRLFPVARL